MCELCNIFEPSSPSWHILLTHMYLWTNYLCISLKHISPPKVVTQLPKPNKDLSAAHGVSGRHYVSVVLIHCLPMDTPYILGHVVDRGCDTPIESFVVHSPNIGARRV